MTAQSLEWICYQTDGSWVPHESSLLARENTQLIIGARGSSIPVSLELLLDIYSHGTTVRIWTQSLDCPICTMQAAV